jgi:hypothetical protein
MAMNPKNQRPLTHIYKITATGEYLLGHVDEHAVIFSHSDLTTPLGYVNANGLIFRYRQHDEQELGSISHQGMIHSHGLFEGGPLGWVDPDGVVIRAGLLFGEEEVGRVEGSEVHAGAAALLLIFLPDDQEAQKRFER